MASATNLVSKPTHDLDELDALLAYVSGLPSVTLESLQALHDQERAQACLAMDEMAKQFAREDVKRKKLWGTKFPRKLGDVPPETTKSVNQVKKAKKRGTK